MDSKMRPLKLVWENGDKYGQNIYMMYKQGDGKFVFVFIDSD